MGIEAVHCAVLPGQVTRIIDLEGQVERVICPKYREADGQCEAKLHVQQGGPLGQLLERVQTHTLGSHDTHCHLK